MNPILQQFDTIGKDAAAKFVRDNAQDVAVLGAEAVKAIFAAEVSAFMPPCPEPTPDMSIEVRAEIELVLEQRSRAAQLIAAAIKQDSARVAALRSSASTLAGNVAKAALVAGAGLVVRALIGG